MTTTAVIRRAASPSEEDTADDDEHLVLELPDTVAGGAIENLDGGSGDAGLLALGGKHHQ